MEVLEMSFLKTARVLYVGLGMAQPTELPGEAWGGSGPGPVTWSRLSTLPHVLQDVRGLQAPA